MSRTASEAHHLFQQGERSALDLVEDSLKAIEADNNRLNAFLAVGAEQARERAIRLDAKRAKGESLGALAGVCVAVKDLICTSQMITTCGSRMLENFLPPYDAAVIERMEAADAIIIGKTNLDEFGMGSSNENSAYGRVCNPWSLERVAGGSSGGAAAAIAADLTPLSLGTDTGGSIRQPAAFCGVVGIKPTYGTVSRYGMVAYASSLDQIGPLARTADDCLLALNVLASHDARDSTSSPTPLKPSPGLRSLAGTRIGIVQSHWGEGISPEVATCLNEVRRWFEDQGAQFVPIELPHARYGIATYYLIAASEASSNLSRFDGIHYGLRDAGSQLESGNRLERVYAGSREAGLGDEVKRRILLGTFALSAGYADAYYGRAARVRRAIQQDFMTAFQSVDLILGPTTPTPPFLAGEKIADPLAMYLADVFTVLANLAGLPAASFPIGFTADQLPLGAQLMGPAYEDRLLLEVIARYQTETQWHMRRSSVLQARD